MSHVTRHTSHVTRHASAAPSPNLRLLLLANNAAVFQAHSQPRHHCTTAQIPSHYYTNSLPLILLSSPPPPPRALRLPHAGHQLEHIGVRCSRSDPRLDPILQFNTSRTSTLSFNNRRSFVVVPNALNAEVKLRLHAPHSHHCKHARLIVAVFHCLIAHPAAAAAAAALRRPHALHGQPSCHGQQRHGKTVKKCNI